MKLFDIFKRKKQEETFISYNELPDWIFEKNKEIEKTKSIIISEIKERLSFLIKDLNENISELKTIDLSSKKADDKLKQIVNENLEKYIININSLLRNLEKLEFNSYEKAIVVIDSMLNDFRKRSLMHYEKATILIGDEIEKTKENLSKFTFDLNNIIKNNSNSIKNDHNIKNINEELNAIITTDGLIDESKKKIMLLEENIKLKENEIIVNKKKIDDIKNSKEYKKELKDKADIIEIKLSLDNKLNELKYMIDFKKLSSMYHSNEKKIKLLNELKENFKDNYLNNKDKLLALLNESDINLTKIIYEENELRRIKSEKEDLFKDILSKEIILTEKLISQLENQIMSLKEDIKKEEKIKEKFEESKISFIEKIKAILMSMNIILK